MHGMVIQKKKFNPISKQMKYHFGVAGWFVWFVHIVAGIALAWIGYRIQYGRSVPPLVGTALLVTGAIMPLYHGHIWIDHLLGKSPEGPQKLENST